MPETTDPDDGGGRGDGTTEPVVPTDTQIDTKPPVPKSNPFLVFLIGFIAGVLVTAGAMATCGGGMGAGREMASTPSAPATPSTAPAPPERQPAPTQPPPAEQPVPR